MRNYWKLLAILAVADGLASCDNFDDPEPSHQRNGPIKITTFDATDLRGDGGTLP
ncbi:MAG: hypothetical protein MJY56_04090 [Bacteroidales bacterium]|nr:hypothetical protein [Bacteroidales bacterium]